MSTVLEHKFWGDRVFNIHMNADGTVTDTDGAMATLTRRSMNRWWKETPPTLTYEHDLFPMIALTFGWNLSKDELELLNSIEISREGDDSTYSFASMNIQPTEEPKVFAFQMWFTNAQKKVGV